MNGLKSEVKRENSQRDHSQPPLDQEILEALKTLTEATRAVEKLLNERLQENSWLPIKEAAPRLGVSDRWILERIRRGAYKHGVQFVNTSDGGRPNYLVSVAAIRKELSKPPEKRNSGIVPVSK